MSDAPHVPDVLMEYGDEGIAAEYLNFCAQRGYDPEDGHVWDHFQRWADGSDGDA